ncbi:hypothetical protein [Marinospirillum perlucidum]|uniref:hypothetical protein n=1 Tax=Marinospirillum perlucidum TaxID=1982602 RepID=UPI000DF4C6A6|nr:hypothetical protein [Marinospirillum perlucidum]
MIRTQRTAFTFPAYGLLLLLVWMLLVTPLANASASLSTSSVMSEATLEQLADADWSESHFLAATAADPCHQEATSCQASSSCDFCSGCLLLVNLPSEEAVLAYQAGLTGLYPLPGGQVTPDLPPPRLL